MKYIIIGNIKKLASIGAVAGKDTTSAPLTENIWNKGLRVKSCNELFIDDVGLKI